MLQCKKITVLVPRGFWLRVVGDPGPAKTAAALLAAILCHQVTSRVAELADTLMKECLSQSV